MAKDSIFFLGVLVGGILLTVIAYIRAPILVDEILEEIETNPQIIEEICQKNL